MVLLAVCLAVACVGCSSHNLKKSVFSEELSPLKMARVFQRERIAHGGNLLVVPFSAGEGVQASDELDHVSLEIVKGISDILQAKGRPFKFLDSEDAQSADLVIKGRVVRLEEKTGFKMLPGKHKILSLAVEGSVIEVQGEEILAKFSQDKKGAGKGDTFENLGYRIGVEIGQFLLSVE